MHISLKNIALLFLLLLSIAGIPLSIWWLSGDGGREPIVGIVAAILVAGSTAYGIDWKNLLISNVEHDRAIFEQGEKLLPEGVIQCIIHDLTSGHYRRCRELEMCDDFHFFCNKEGNAFLCRSLQKSRHAFNYALDLLGKYTGTTFSLVSESTMRLFPEMIRKMEGGDIKAIKEFEEHRARLEGMAITVASTYGDYRRMVKKRLKI